MAATRTGFLLDNASVTTPTADIVGWKGGTYCFAVDGTFGGATVSLDMLSPDGSSWLTIASSGLTAEGAIIVDLPEGRYRALVAGGSPSALYATLKRVSAN